MERRKFTIGLGALATGSAAAMGTSAFSQVVADRDVDLEIAGDENAYLGLEALDEDYASEAGDGTLELDFTNNGEGNGINNRADSVFEDVFSITNQGTEPIYVWTGFDAPDGGSGNDPTSGGARSVELVADGTDITYPGAEDKSSEPETSRSLGQTEDTGAIKLEVGDSVDVDIRFLVYGSGDPRDSDFRIVFNAQQEDPDGTTVADHTIATNDSP